MLRLDATLLISLIVTARVSSCSNVSAFDDAKEEKLTPERRRVLDVIFFNDLATANTNTNRYITEEEARNPALLAAKPGDPMRRRVDELREMAAEGYFPAYAALALFRGSYEELARDKSFFAGLRAKADKGDLSSTCFLGAVTIAAEAEQASPGLLQNLDTYLQRGAGAGHGACLAWRAKRKWSLSALDPGASLSSKHRLADELKPDLLESARQGYFFAQWTLFDIHRTFIAAKNYQATALEIERALCWGRLAQQHSNFATVESLTSFLRTGPSPKADRSLFPMIDSYRSSVVPITRKIATPEKCLLLEEQGESK